MRNHAILMVLGLVFLPLFTISQPWQQSVSYKMEIDFDVKQHQFSGKQLLVYTNNSPDTLHKLFYHLYFNAFQPNSMMDMRSRSISDPDRRVASRIAALSEAETGYHKIQSLSLDGKALSFDVVGSILEVSLDEPIMPGQESRLEMQFDSQVPIQIRRSGRDNREGIDYSMAQWYPKLCEYDGEGWHSNPYIGREFHGVWGDFEVEINMDAAYMLAATGVLQNPEEIGMGYGPDPDLSVISAEDGTLSWKWKAEKVHDFVWAADRDYIHERLKVAGGPELHFFFQPNVKEVWQQLKPYAARCFQIMNQTFGKYPYEKYSIIQGGDGGMEYPMATLITGDRDINSLIGVTVHEAIHSWYQMVLATNESLYYWMDEGFTSYAEDLVTNSFRQRPIVNPVYGSYMRYLSLVEDELEEPSSTHADHFNTNRAYSVAAYSKGSIMLHQLSYIMGQQTFLKAMKRYYHTWQFKHPTPTDFKRVMEKSSGLELDWYFEYWIHTTKTIDYQIELKNQASFTEIAISRVGDMPMPIDLVVRLKDGRQFYYYVPLVMMRGGKSENPFPDAERVQMPDWPWTQSEYSIRISHDIKDIAAVELDPTYRMADIQRKNNLFPKPDKQKKEELKVYGGILSGGP